MNQLLAGSLRTVLLVAALLALAIVHAFTALAVRFAQWPESDSVRQVLGIVYFVGVAVGLLALRPFRRTAALSLLPPLAIYLLYGLIEPKRTADYPPETSRAATVDFTGDRFTIHDVRNFDYRTETDFDPRWEDRTYDLADVRTLDLFGCFWTEGKRIGHTFLSFGFSDGRFLAVSIEIRRETNEEYGPLEGAFRHYELIYVWGDERDLVRLRTNFRGEEVFLYRTTCSPTDTRLLLADMLHETDAIARDPVFYHTILRSCTSSIVRHVNAVLPKTVPWYRRRLLNGYDFGDRRAWEQGWIAGSGTFDEVRARSRINDRARAAETDPQFSARIRTHVGS